MKTLIILFLIIITAIRLIARLNWRIRKREKYPRRVIWTEREDSILAVLHFLFLIILIGSIYL